MYWSDVEALAQNTIKLVIAVVVAVVVVPPMLAFCGWRICAICDSFDSHLGESVHPNTVASRHYGFGLP